MFLAGLDYVTAHHGQCQPELCPQKTMFNVHIKSGKVPRRNTSVVKPEHNIKITTLRNMPLDTVHVTLFRHILEIGLLRRTWSPKNVLRNMDSATMTCQILTWCRCYHYFWHTFLILNYETEFTYSDHSRVSVSALWSWSEYEWNNFGSDSDISGKIVTILSAHVVEPCASSGASLQMRVAVAAMFSTLRCRLWGIARRVASRYENFLRAFGLSWGGVIKGWLSAKWCILPFIDLI